MAFKELNEISNTAASVAGTDNIALQTNGDVTKKCPISVLLNTGYIHTISGFAISNNASTPNTHLDIGAGIASTSTMIRYARNASSFTKRIDQTWVVGTGNGGMASGVSLAADTWYNVFAIMNDTTLAVDFVFDTSITCANIPAGYQSYARVGSVLTDASSYISTFVFSEIGGIRHFQVYSPIKDGTYSLASANRTIIQLKTPPGIKSMAIITVNFEADAGGAPEVIFTDPDCADVQPGGGGTSDPIGHIKSNSTLFDSHGQFFVQTNTSSSIGARCSASGNEIHLTTLGWYDPANKIFS